MFSSINTIGNITSHNTVYADAMVPVPERTAETSLLYSCCKQISVKKPKNKKEVVVQVYAYYHKDIDICKMTTANTPSIVKNIKNIILSIILYFPI
jgi:hypothetical protein